MANLDDIPVFGISTDSSNRYRAQQAERAQAALREFVTSKEINGVRFEFKPACPNLWKSETDLPKWDAQLRNPTKMVFAEVCVTPITWLRLQLAQQAAFFGESNPDVDTFLHKFNPDDPEGTNVQIFIDKLRGDLPTDIPIPAFEIGTNAKVVGAQEGRTRGVAAYYAGVESMNCLIAVRTERDGKERDINVPTSRQFRSYLDRFSDTYARAGDQTFTTAPPAERWDRLMERSHQAVEELGIDQPLPERDLDG